MYKFVKIKSKLHGDENKSGSWYFKPNSIDQVVEHFKTIFGKEISAGIRDKMHAGWAKHPDTAWRYAVDLTCNTKGMGWDCHGLPWLEEAIKLENIVLQGRIKDFTKGIECLFANGVQQLLFIPDYHEIVEEIEKDILEYPIEEQYHFEDVRYSKWDMDWLTVKGTHWYAKIGNLDVKDKDGNMKWNTKEEAEDAARWFCQELNWKRNLSHN